MNAPEQRAVAAAAAQAIEGRDPDFDRLLQKEYTPRDMLLEGDSFDRMLRMAEHLANSALSLPKELKGNVGDCLAIVTQAMMWNLNPFAVAQKAHVINGKLGYEAQLVNAIVMQSRAIVGSFSYEYEGQGDALKCRVGAVLRGSKVITWNEWYSVSQAAVKNSPLWKTNPKQQLGYVQVKNWARAFVPGALLGIYTADELEDFADARASTPPPPPAAPALPEYPAADFDKNLPAWTKLVASGKKSPADLLATLSTKAAFNESQKAQILSLKKTPAPAPDPAPEPENRAGSHDDFVADMEAAEGAQGGQA